MPLQSIPLVLPLRGRLMSTRVLAVDDEPAILNLLQLLLEHLDCEVSALTDSRVAVERVSQQEFDAIFLDGQMPHVDGLELTRIARDSAKNRLTPIVMLTGSPLSQSGSSSLREGVSFQLGKPFDLESLKRALIRIGVRTSAD